MRINNKTICGTCLLFLVSCLFLFSFSAGVFASPTSALRITINPLPQVCGDGIIEIPESCDGANLAGQTCVTRGYASGTLSCKADCTLNTSQCQSGGGGGGGGGGAAVVVTQVTFIGRAYPMSKVSILKDGQLAVSTIGGPDSIFSVALSGLAAGNYIFSVYSEDSGANRSSMFTFPVYITLGATTSVSGIFLAPTIAVDKSEVKRGDNIAIFGQSAPNADITIAVNSDAERFVYTKADKNGAYLFNFDTQPLEEAQHTTKAKAKISNDVSSFSNLVSFTVGTKTVLATPGGKKCPAKADLNSDCRVNLVDFSIAAYWYKRTPNADFKTIEKSKLNGDGKMDLIDFSIMAYYWTG